MNVDVINSDGRDGGTSGRVDVEGAGGLLDEKGGDCSLVVGLVNTPIESEVHMDNRIETTVMHHSVRVYTGGARGHTDLS